jgi:predicted transcriptional regulator of viral defense system
LRQKNTIQMLGPIETKIVARLTYEKLSIVKAVDLDRLFNLSPDDRKQIVFRLKNKRILTAVKPGVYIFSPLESGPLGTSIDELLIPPLFFPKKNYYIGYSTMFNYYNLTQQLFQTVYVINSSSGTEKKINGILYKFIKVQKNRIYGFDVLKIGDYEVNISSKERTLIDLLVFHQPVGGIVSAVDIFKKNATKEMCDIKKLVDFASRYPSVTLRKRIGLILEEMGTSDKTLKPLLDSVQQTAISSLNQSRKGKINQKWKVIMNDSR